MDVLCPHYFLYQLCRHSVRNRDLRLGTTVLELEVRGSWFIISVKWTLLTKTGSGVVGALSLLLGSNILCSLKV